MNGAGLQVNTPPSVDAVFWVNVLNGPLIRGTRLFYLDLVYLKQCAPTTATSSGSKLTTNAC